MAMKLAPLNLPKSPIEITHSMQDISANVFAASTIFPNGLFKWDRKSRLGKTSFEENISRRSAFQENEPRCALASSGKRSRYDFDLAKSLSPASRRGFAFHSLSATRRDTIFI